MDEIQALPAKVDIMDVIERSSCAELDRLEALLGLCDKRDCPIVTVFTNGLYAREILMEKGTMVCSKIHKTQHQFIISKGKVSVWYKDKGWETYEAPYHGVTEPGTRRFLYNHEDTTWTTFHPNPENIGNLDQLEEMLILKHELSTIDDYDGDIENLLTSIPIVGSNILLNNKEEISI